MPRTDVVVCSARNVDRQILTIRVDPSVASASPKAAPVFRKGMAPDRSGRLRRLDRPELGSKRVSTAIATERRIGPRRRHSGRLRRKASLLWLESYYAGLPRADR